ncbi:hypothetical protein FXO38_01023 [Capsicum annuum]|nr:hypothetical protein FXO38_01023 [Capsicum annuum]
MKYRIDKVPDHHLHILSSCNRGFAEDIKSYFGEDVLGAFRNTLFEIFLDLPQCNWIGQISKCILMLEIQQDIKDEIHVCVQGKIFKFTMLGFVIITGLKCTDDIDEFMYTSSSKSPLMSKYFSESGGGITRSKLITRVKMRNFENSKDAFNLAILYFVHTFMLSQHKEAPISVTHFQMIEDGDEDQLRVVIADDDYDDFTTRPTQEFLRKAHLASPLSTEQASKGRKTVMFQEVSPAAIDEQKSISAPSVRHVSGEIGVSREHEQLKFVPSSSTMPKGTSKSNLDMEQIKSYVKIYVDKQIVEMKTLIFNIPVEVVKALKKEENKESSVELMPDKEEAGLENLGKEYSPDEYIAEKETRSTEELNVQYTPDVKDLQDDADATIMESVQDAIDALLFGLSTPSDIKKIDVITSNIVTESQWSLPDS